MERVTADWLTLLPVREVFITKEASELTKEEKARLPRGGTHGAKVGEPGAMRGRLLEGWASCGQGGRSRGFLKRAQGSREGTQGRSPLPPAPTCGP